MKIPPAEAAKAQEHDAHLENEHRLSDIINFLPDATFAIDENGMVIAWNHAIEEMTGVPAEEMIGKGDYAYAVPFYGKRRPMLIDLAFKDDLELRSRYDLLKEMPGVIEAETRYARPKQEEPTLWARVSPLYNRNGEYRGAIETIRDITKRNRSEALLKGSEIRYRRLFEAAQDGILILDDEGEIIDANPFILDMLGYHLDELLGRTLPEIGLLRDKNLAEKAFLRLKEEGYIRYEDLPLETKDGRQMAVEFISNRYLINDHSVIQCNIRDVTERKHIEAALHSSESLQRLILTAMPDILIRCNAEGRYLDILTPEDDRFILPKEEIIGKTIAEVTSEEIGERLVQAITLALETGEMQTIEYALSVPAGHRHFEARISPYAADEVIALIRDITDRKEAEDALHERIKELSCLYRISATIEHLHLTETEVLRKIPEIIPEGFQHPEKTRVRITIDDSTYSTPGFTLTKWSLVREIPIQQQAGGTITVCFDDEYDPLTEESVMVRSIAEQIGRYIERIRGAEMLQQKNEDLATAEEELRSQLDELVATQQQLRESEEYIRTVLDNLPIGVAVNSVDPEVNFEYFNKNFLLIYRTTADALQNPDAFWDVVYLDPVFRSELRERVLSDIQSGDPARMHWEDIPITREGEETTYINAMDIPVPGKDLAISTVWDVTDRVKAEGEIKRRLAFEMVISDMSSRFVTESDIDVAIDKALGDIGSFCGASRSYIFLLDSSGDEMSNTHEWCAEGVTPMIEQLQKQPTNLFPWWMEQLRMGENIQIQSLDDLPPEAAAEREILELQGIESLIVLPLLIRSTLGGFIGFDNVTEIKNWTEEDVHLLRLSSELIGSAFEQKKAEEQIALHIRRTEALLALHGMSGAKEQELMDYVLDAALQTTDSRYAFIGTMNDDESVMTVHAWSEGVMEKCRVRDTPIQFPIESGGVWGECVMTRSPTLINLYEAPHPTKHGLPEGHVPITRYLSVPVLLGSRVFAVLAVANKEDEYRDDDISALATLGNLMGELIFRQRAEAALQKSEERYRYVSTIITDFAYSCLKEDGGDYQIDWMAGATQQITGYEIDEVIAEKCWGFMIHPDDWQIFEDSVLSLPEGESSECDLRIITKHGNVRWLSAETRCIHDETGRSRIYGGCRDITEEKLAGLELELNQARLESAMEAGGLAWWEMDCLTGLVIFSPRKAEMLGYSPDRFSHYTDFTALLHPDDLEMAMQAMRDHLEGRADRYEVEYRIRSSEGAYLWFRDIGSVTERDASGAPLKVVGLVINITTIKEAVEALRESEKRFKTLFMDSPVSIIIHDRDTGEIIDANPKACESYGYSSVEELKAADFWLEPPYSFEDALTYIRKAASGELEEFEWLNRSVTGEFFWVQVRLSSAVISGVKRILATSVDITERKKAEMALRESEALLSTAGRMAHFGGWSANLDENRVIWSEEVAKIHGMEPGYSPSIEEGISFYAPEWKEKMRRVFGECVRHGTRYDEEMEIITATGERRWVRTTGEAVKNEHGRITGVHGALQDITQRKEAEEAWKNAYAQIEDNMVKFSVLNDQIRNPLTVIMALADLDGGESAEKIIEQVKAIDRIVTLLDQGVLESESIRMFMRRHDQLSG
ncbi:MAG: Putative PAS/PAC sensor protein [Methanomicrobiales archaeon 53_19]|uniref:PAS domain S-box protein n=1 Tax=Methanocalculus sp. TaxID=2004547 RepID=UPI000749982F|nr:PAS domain S-box protein [Methanocalculus sp.]KUK69540.1 MAG: Putative PAS/PAC sensor protein [Methanocalculus sp. 52_23]KUL03163.1 MAG: Putative PAS/PAC sensor protein [Methanomicrobiales archaeon 53_19]HIJ07325.1 PAS domain S-box protein [Methanocalculus sp.]